MSIEDETNVSLLAPDRTKLEEAKEMMERLVVAGLLSVGFFINFVLLSPSLVSVFFRCFKLCF